MILEDGPLFIADTQVNPEPTPRADHAESVIGAARHVRRFGLVPKSRALFTQSQVRQSWIQTPPPSRMRAALEHP